MRSRTHSMLIVAILSSSLALAVSQARAAADFSLGSSTLSVGVENDSTQDGGCMNTTNDGCDSYKFKVSLTVDPNNDILDDLATPSDFLRVGVSSTEFCNTSNQPDFAFEIPHSSLILKKTKSEDTVMFTGMADAETPTKSAMVPVKLLVQVHKNGKGFFIVSGVGDLTPLHGDTSAIVGLSLDTSDSDADTDFACTSMTQKDKSQN